MGSDNGVSAQDLKQQETGQKTKIAIPQSAQTKPASQREPSRAEKNLNSTRSTLEALKQNININHNRGKKWKPIRFPPLFFPPIREVAKPEAPKPVEPVQQ